MVADYEQECWNSDYSFYAFFVAIPSLVLWGVGIPAYAFFYMLYYYRKGLLFTPSLIKKCRFLYIGYKSENYYWECFITLRKISLVMISVAFNKNIKL